MAGRGSDDKIRALYALPPEEFTAARNALAKELQLSGAAHEAREVGGLRKPTVAVWAVNQAARAETARVRELLDAGAALARAQKRALAGDGGELVAAGRDLRKAVFGVASAAERLIGTPAAAVKQRVWQLLQAAATGTQKERDRLEGGWLPAELESARGFDGDVPEELVDKAPAETAPREKAPAETAPREKASAARKRKEEEQSRARAAKAEEKARARAAKAEAAKAKAIAAAEREVARARAELERAERRLDAARRA